MKQYLIYPDSISGHSIISNGEYSPYPHGTFPKGAIVMEIDSLDYHKNLFRTSAPGHYFVTTLFKEILEKANFGGLDFSPIDFLIIGLNLKENYPNHGFDESSFWKFELDKKKSDFYSWKGNLVVSEDALSFLYEHKAFKDRIEGHVYGKEYEVLTNKFLVEGSIENFVANKLPEHMEHINTMRKRITNEYRKQVGLPVLH